MLTTLSLRNDTSKSRREAEGRRWVEAQDALRSLGYKGLGHDAEGFAQGLSVSRTSLAQLRWLLDQGISEGWEKTRGKKGFWAEVSVTGLVETLSEDGAEEHAMLEWTAKVGLVGGSDRGANPTDFAIAGLWGCVQKLTEMGFKPGPARLPHSREWLDPIVALCSSFCPRGSALARASKLQIGHEAKWEAKAQLEHLNVFVALGARVGPSPQEKPEGNAFHALMGGGELGYGRGPSMEMLCLMGPRLVELGFDPAAGGLLLERCVAMQVEKGASSQLFTLEEGWEWATSLGAAVGPHAGSLLSWAAVEHLPESAIDMVNRLSALGVDPSLVTRDAKRSPVHSAFMHGKPELAWHLVECGSPIDYVDENGETALHHAAGSSDKKGLALLKRLLAIREVKKMVDAKSTGKGCEGERSLHRACSAISIESVRLLLDHGADPNERDAKGWTPLRHLLRKYGEKAKKKVEPCLALLLERGADPGLADNKGRTPAQAVAGKAPFAALEALLTLRPEDVAGPGELAAKARSDAAARGGRGGSMVERIQLGMVTAPEAADGAKREPAARRSRL